MAYARRRRDTLGIIGIDDALAIAGTIKGFNALKKSLFGSGNVDAQRAQRANWMIAAAKEGSAIAARVVLDAQGNTSNNEWQHQWQPGVSQIPAAVLNAARQLGNQWPAGDPDFNMTATKNRVIAEIQGNGAATGNTSTATTSRAQLLPGMTTTAPFNWMPWILGGGAIAAVVLGPQLFGKRRRR